ncbi:hypothetical protein [Lactonifactor longoviformis]|nr:hypothetical protein [Lactonifactor longoviformis]
MAKSPLIGNNKAYESIITKPGAGYKEHPKKKTIDKNCISE